MRVVTRSGAKADQLLPLHYALYRRTTGWAAVAKAPAERLALRQLSARLIGNLHQCLLKLQPDVLPKSPSGAAVRYALNQWEALTRFLEDGELEIDNGTTERANRDIALGPRQLAILRQ